MTEIHQARHWLAVHTDKEGAASRSLIFYVGLHTEPSNRADHPMVLDDRNPSVTPLAVGPYRQRGSGKPLPQFYVGITPR